MAATWIVLAVVVVIVLWGTSVFNRLVQKNEVLAFVQARADEGGAGAVVVLLKPT